jgi:hypothetical protein
LCWLLAEQNALAVAGGAKRDCAVLERSAQPLLVLFNDRRGADGAARRKQQPAAPRADRDSGALLSRARAVIALQKETIEKLKGELAAISTDAAAPDERHGGEGFSATLDLVNQNTDSQLASTAKLEKELAAAQASYRQVSEELARLQTQVGTPGRAAGGSGLLIVNTDAAGFSVGSARTLLDDMEDAHSESINELKRMRATNARQRALILQLEQELSVMRKGSGEESASQMLLDNLKAQLRDYENCTVVLEMETDNLRTKIETLNRILEGAEQSGTINMVDNLQQEIAGSADIRLQHQRQVAACLALAKLAAADSIERATPQLTALLGDLQLSFAVYIKGSEKQYWLSSDAGSIDNRIRQLLQSVVPGAEATWTEVKNGAVFVGSSLRLFVEDTAASIEEFAAIKNFLSPQLDIINALLFHIDIKTHQPRQLLKLNNLFSQASKQLSGIDVQHHYLTEENARIGEKLHAEMQQYFASLALTDIQQECIEAMLEDFKSEVNLLSKASQAIHNNLRAAVHTLTPNE